MKVLVLAAHPDDEVLGCGGTIARLAAGGADVSILILAEGLTSRVGFDPARDQPLLNLHRERALRAGAILGAREVRFSGFPDQKLDTIPLLDVTHAIEAEIARVVPEIVYTHHGGDLNMDHVIVHRATLTATRPTGGCPVRRLHTYEIASSTEWAFQSFAPVFRPTTFVDITPFLERKVEAMEVYASEARPFPHPRSPQALRAAAHRWGSQAGLHAAEAFQCVREIV